MIDVPELPPLPDDLWILGISSPDVRDIRFALMMWNSLKHEDGPEDRRRRAALEAKFADLVERDYQMRKSPAPEAE